MRFLCLFTRYVVRSREASLLDYLSLFYLAHIYILSFIGCIPQRAELFSPPFVSLSSERSHNGIPGAPPPSLCSLIYYIATPVYVCLHFQPWASTTTGIAKEHCRANAVCSSMSTRCWRLPISTSWSDWLGVLSLFSFFFFELCLLFILCSLSCRCLCGGAGNFVICCEDKRDFVFFWCVHGSDLMALS